MNLNYIPNDENHRPQLKNAFLTKREFLGKFGTGFGMLGLASLLGPELIKEAGAQSSANLLAPKAPQFKGTAKRVIHILMSGGQSHIDTWDPKPELEKKAGMTAGTGMGRGGGKLLPSPFKFIPSGKSGLELSEIWPNISKHADDMTIIRSMNTAVPAHEEATLLMTCGDFRLPKPSMGSWVLYGLGTENQNIPGFVVLGGNNGRNWGSAFMPGHFQGTNIDPRNTKIETLIENIKSGFTSGSQQRQQLDLLYQLNEVHKQKRKAEAQLEARIQSFELAYRMQTEATEAFDVSRESDKTIKAYGEGGHARQMIIARRLLERGVRFVQVWQGGWDTHAGIQQNMPRLAGQSDQPIAAFMQDLKDRGLFKDTLIVCSSEFGRSSTQDGPGGRTHNNKAMSAWLAGGGVKGGFSYGATDELGSAAVESPVDTHDLHATILHLLGFDHEKLTFRSGGRDFRLTDVFGKVAKGVIA